MKRVSLSALASLVLAVGGCGSSGPGKGNGSASPLVSVGGKVTGLLGSGLVLQNNGGDDLAIGGDGEFTFATKIPSLTAYRVTVKQQPTTPSQTCVVASGVYTGSSSNVTDVLVTCTTNAYAVGGTVVGLQGSGLVLENNGGDDLSPASDGAFRFATPVASGATFTVTVKTQPSGPTQSCKVMGGSGTVGGGDVTSVVVNCSTNTYTVGGTVSGLAGAGLVLQDNGGDNLSVTANGTFAFATPIKSGGSFAVTVLTQPSAPTQTCAVTMGSGAVVAANVTTVNVTCTTNRYQVGGTVMGLAGAGLVLQDNLGDNLPVGANGSFTFATSVSSGATYSVTVLSQPTSPWQTCTVTNGSGTITNADVTSVSITCSTNSYKIGGSVAGLAGAGLVLQDNGGDDLPISANGSFQFATAVASGGAYLVTIKAQPTNPWQTCTVMGGSGAVAGGDVNTVSINCTTDQHGIGGSVAGLAGSGLLLSLNGGAAIAINANGTYSFPNLLASGTAYTVTVTGQPTSPWQTCAVANASGTVAGSDVTNVNVTCTTNTYKIGGSVTGVAGAGLVLQDNGGDDLPISADGNFVFATPVASGANYLVTIKTQPTSPWQTCAVTNGGGIVAGADVTNVTVTCTTDQHYVGGVLSGLAGTVVLQDNGGDNLTLTANGSFRFATPVASGAPYAVTVATQPGAPSQTCTVTNGGGTISNADVTSVSVTCTTNTYKIGGTVMGLAGSGLVLQDNGGDNLAISGNGAFQFNTAIASGQTFNVTVGAQPQGPWQSCSVSGGSGTVGGGDVTSVVVNCTTNQYSVGGTVSGLGSASGLVLQNNGGDNLSVSADGSFAFNTPLPSGATYNVTVRTNPTAPWETCTVTGGTGSGTVAGGPVTSVQVTCTANTYNIIASLSGLAGSGLTLQDNGAANLSPTSNATYPFAIQVASGQTYNVTVLQNPTNPWQTCTVPAPTGVVGGGDVTVSVSCTTNSYAIGGTVTGLTSSSVVLQDNGGDNLTLNANGGFTFATPIASGVGYNVTVKTQPTNGQQCLVTNGSGTVTNGPITSVKVTCATPQKGCGAPTGSYHWALLENAPCNAWCGGGAPQWACFPSGNTFACNAQTVSGWLWMYSTSTTPPPNPVTSNDYGWVTRYCNNSSCFTQAGGTGCTNCSCSGSYPATIWECCN